MAVYSWMGPYLGANLGYQWGETTNNPTEPSGIAGGVQAGYNWQYGQFVFGGEADIQLSGADDTSRRGNSPIPGSARVRGRAGFALEQHPVLRHRRSRLWRICAAKSPACPKTSTHLGWTAGLGVEVGLTPNWSASSNISISI